MTYDAEIMGERLRLGLKAAHISQRELARRIGVSHETVSNWVHGRGLSLITAAAVADELGWSLDRLVGRQNPEEQYLLHAMQGEPDPADENEQKDDPALEEEPVEID